MMKKIISLLMVLCLMASLCSMSAFAEEVAPPTANVETIASKSSPLSIGFISWKDGSGSTKLDYAVNYVVDKSDPELFEKQKEVYGERGADFVVSLSNVSGNTINYWEDLRLFGAYDEWDNGTWYDLDFLAQGMLNEPIDISEPIRLGLGEAIPFSLVAEFGSGFSCGVDFSDSFVEANPDVVVNVQLVLEDENGVFQPVGEPVVYEPPFDLQAAVDMSSSDATITLQGDVELSEPVKIPEGAELKIELGDNTLEEAFSYTDGFSGSIFELPKDASVKIVGKFSPEEVELIRRMVSEDYCVYKGSIVVRGSHEYVDGVCKCGEKLPSGNVPATADNSNMPLWSLLFIGFAAVAVLTGKKKKA